MITVEEVKNLKQKGFTNEKLADYYGVSISTIKRFISKNNLQTKTVKIDKDNFLDLYNQGLNDIEISEKLNLSEYAIAKFRKSLNLLSQTDKKREENKTKFLDLYNRGLNDTEISKELGVNNVTIKNWRESLDLPSNFKYERSFDTSKFKELYDQGLNYVEISKILKVSDSAISEYAVSLNLTNNLYNKSIPTYEEEQIILGTIYGDGYLQLTSKHARGMFAHSLKQEGYCKWKIDKLKRFMTEPRYKQEYDTRTSKIYSCVYAYFRASEYLTNIYPLFYNNKVKYINKELLYKIDELGLAVWFMDDGYKESCGYKIATNCFSNDDLEIIKDYFKDKFDINITIHSNHTIYIGAKYKDKFTELVKPYIHPDCLYKLHMSPLNSVNSVENLEKENTELNSQEIEKNA